MNLRTPGIFALTDSMTATQLTALVRKVDRLGYSTFWFPEAFGRDPFALAAHILTVTEKVVVGTGIANVWKREPIASSHASPSAAWRRSFGRIRSRSNGRLPA